MKNKYFCIHAHFGLPLQENPWLGSTEQDNAAAPYRDSYERLFDTCIGPNGASPLLDTEGNILRFVNNYAQLSFDVPPYYLEWMQRRHPAAYERILDADRISAARRSGHGGAIATAYSPNILPLESADDKRTSIVWGIEDFCRRFHRAPEGFWLPENAVDEATLETLIDAGIRFTLLSPRQACSVRPIGSPTEKGWYPVTGETLDSDRAYRWFSPRGGGRSLAVFFYREDLSPEKIYGKLPLAVSMENPLKTSREQVIEVGRSFSSRLIDALSPNDAVEISHVAVEGDLFGYRRLGGNRSLTYALDALDSEAPARLTNYGEFLELVPPPQEVRLHTPSSRSCAHGVKAWTGTCECRPEPWRAPLRLALERASRELANRAETILTPLVHNPARTVAAYGAALSDQDEGTIQDFLDAQTSSHLTPGASRTVLRTCELQLSRLKMLSRWGGEGDGIDSPLTLQALTHAARALDLLRLVDDQAEDIERKFLEDLSLCVESGSRYLHAAEVYNKVVRPGGVGMRQALAHFAVADHLSGGPIPAVGSGSFFAWEAPDLESSVIPLCRRTRRRSRRMECLSVVEVTVRHRRTYQRASALAAVVHVRHTDLTCWVETGIVPTDIPLLAARLDTLFLRGAHKSFSQDAAVILPTSPFTLGALFPSARRQAILHLLPRGGSPRQEFLGDWHRTLRTFRSNPAQADVIIEHIAHAAAHGIDADALPDIHLFREYVLESTRTFSHRPDPKSLDRLSLLLDTAGQAGLHLPLWEIQKLTWDGIQNMKMSEDDEEISRWLASVLGISLALTQSEREA